MPLPRPLARTIHRRRARRAPRLAAATAAVLAGAGLLVAGPSVTAVTGVTGDTGAQAAAVPAGSPTGVAEHIWLTPGGVGFSGWARDPNTTAAVTVYLTVDGKRSTAAGASTVANLPRPDLAQKTPAADGHGFSSSVRLPTGRHTLCVWAKNVGKGANRELRCVTTTLDYSPKVKVQTFSASSGHIHVAGWAYDSDTRTGPLTVLVTVDKKTTTLRANRVNADVVRHYPRAGTRHGFSASIPVAQGKHSVCITVRNVGYGKDAKNVKCGTLTLDDRPVGTINTAVRDGTRIHLRGWTYDPDSPTTVLTVRITVDGVLHTAAAGHRRDSVGEAHPSAGRNHGFDTLLTTGEGSHKVCVTAVNVSYGSNRSLGCRTVTLRFTPTAGITAVSATSTGLKVSGWATDPDTSKPIKAKVWISGGELTKVTAGAKASSHSGHAFTTTLPARSGKRRVCVVGLNVGYGTHNSVSVCKTITLALSPLGHFDSVARKSGSTSLVVTGWAFDPDTTGATKVTITVDGKTAGTYAASVTRSDVYAKYPSAGSSRHGFARTVGATDGEHRVCVTAVNVGGGSSRSLGCKVIAAVHPAVPSTPRSVAVKTSYGSAKITWKAPSSDGGAPVSYYTVTSGKTTAKVAAGSTSYTATKLKAKTKYTWVVRAVNVAGSSAGAKISGTTPAGPPPQTTPAPVSTSRYIRNVRAATATDVATMRKEGVADAKANPSGHKYLILLDIGGQDQYDGGVALSATAHFVSYPNLVTDLKAYVAGYASAQKASAPITIALGTNNDMDVSASAGKAWADKVVDPVRSYAARYPNMKITGANDIEPGFSATYSQSRAWLTGYLGATSAGFVFNGSADGCSWTTTDRRCNNGWTMKGLYTLAQGAAPGRIVNLPQIYNTTMAAQWKYISLTGLKYGQPRIAFGGPLTEWTACSQARSCGSLTGHTAWSELWNDLRSDARLKISTLPYSTDLRIDS